MSSRRFSAHEKGDFGHSSRFETVVVLAQRREATRSVSDSSNSQQRRPADPQRSRMVWLPCHCYIATAQSSQIISKRGGQWYWTQHDLRFVPHRSPWPLLLTRLAATLSSIRFNTAFAVTGISHIRLTELLLQTSSFIIPQSHLNFEIIPAGSA